MQTSYPVNQPIAVAGLSQGAARRTRPRSLPFLAQITQGVIAASESGNWVHTFVDDLTQQSYTLTTVVSGAVEATTLDELVAALQAHPKLRDLFTITEDGVDTYLITARHANRSWTVTSVPPGSMTDTITISQASGGAGIQFGRFVAKGPGDLEFSAVSATTTVANLAGMLFRTEANHFHQLENELPSDVDASERGWTYPIMEEGRIWVEVEDAVTPASVPHVRRAQTSGVGEVGALRATAAGGQQLDTVTPTAAELDYMILIEWTPPGGAKQSVPLLAANPDGTNSATETCDAFRVAAATAQADGLLAGFTFGGTATLTIQGPAGETFRTSDVGEGISAVANTTPADADTLDVSALCSFETTAAAGGLALLRVHL